MSNATATGSIRSLPERDRTSTPHIRDDVLELRARSAEARDQAATLASDIEDLHDRVQAVDLDDRTTALQQNDPADLLAFLGEERGIPWSLAAYLVGVSPTAVRKWRRGGALTPESRARLARLVAFCQWCLSRPAHRRHRPVASEPDCGRRHDLDPRRPVRRRRKRRCGAAQPCGEAHHRRGAPRRSGTRLAYNDTSRRPPSRRHGARRGAVDRAGRFETVPDVALAAPRSSEELYLARGDDVVPSRPILTGDVFADVERDTDDHDGLAMVVAHPCSMRGRGGTLLPSIAVAPIRPYQTVPFERWPGGHFKVLPLPGLYGADDISRAVHLLELSAVLSSELGRSRRILTLSGRGIHVLQQRLVYSLTRVVVGLDRLQEQSAAVLLEAELEEEWVDELAEGDLDAAAQDFAAYMDGGHREALKDATLRSDTVRKVRHRDRPTSSDAVTTRLRPTGRLGLRASRLRHHASPRPTSRHRRRTG